MPKIKFLQRLPLALLFVVFTSAQLLGAAWAAPGAPVIKTMSAFDGLLVTQSLTPVTLAEDGKALLPIVISPAATDATKAVAAELADYLKQISGASFEVKTGALQNGQLPNGIVLGNLSEFPIASLSEPLEIHEIYDGKEAFAIRSLPAANATAGAGKVLLIGGSDLGASHAVFRFLELLGCRWFFMAPEWTVVPKNSDLKFDLNETTRPKVMSRKIWFNYGYPVRKEQDDYKAWLRHNRMAESLQILYIHGYGAIIYENMKEFEAHPEYYGLSGGKRVGWKMCVSNPAVRRMAVTWALGYLKKYGGDMVTMEPPDGDWGWCECPECAKLGTLSDRVFGLANEVARAVAKEYPGKMVGVLAYSTHSDPPSFKLEPNVHVGFCKGYAAGKYTQDEKMALWPQYSDNRGVYEYLAMYPWGQERLRPANATGIAGSATGLAARLRKDIAWGMKSFQGESSCNFGQYGLGYYVTQRVLWNPAANTNSLLADFYQKAFGPAAPVMKRFYERLDSGSGRHFGPDFLAHCYRDLDEAAQLTQDTPDVQARLDQLKQYLHFNYLQWQEMNAGGNDAAKPWTLARLTLLYRTRYSYMEHSAAMLQEAPEYAKNYNEPTWAAADAPWKVDKPYTHEETEAAFQEGLKFFQPQPVIEKKFDEDHLVPVRFTEDYKTIPDAWSVIETEPRSYLVQSIKGEPIEVQTHMSPTPEGRAVSYVLKDKTGKIVSQGECKTGLAGMKVYALQLKVPAAGQYELTPGSVFMNFSFGAGVPAALKLYGEQGLQAYAAIGAQRFYIYVPKGTREISLYSIGPGLQFFDPAGKMVADLANASFQNKLIPVPEGMDGKVWGMGGRIGVLTFYNLPNLVALSPDAFLLPRDLAIDDGLTIRR